MLTLANSRHAATREDGEVMANRSSTTKTKHPDAEQPSAFTAKDCLVCAGVVIGLGVFGHGLLGHGTLAQSPISTGAAGHIMAIAVQILIGAALVAVAVALMVVTVAINRGQGLRYRRYRRRWARSLRTLGLATEKRGELLVPRLRSVTTRENQDVLRVRMLENQSPQDWDGRVRRIAAEFGAAAARCTWTPERTEEIELVLTRRGRRQTKKEVA